MICQHSSGWGLWPRFGRGLVVATGLLMLTACGPDTATHADSGAVKTIEGQVLYRERIALPPSAEIEIELQDISQPDAPAATLATLSLPNLSGPPYPFKMNYSAADIDADRRYALRAAIRVEGQVLFSNTDYVNPFGEQPLEIMLSQVPTASAESKAEPSALDGSSWHLLSLAGEPAATGEGGKVLDLHFRAATEASAALASGFSGCNRFSGGFNSDVSQGDRGSLNFRELASTMMACAEGEEIERSYLTMLSKVDAFRLDQDRLSLLADGKELAAFEAAE